MKIFLYLILLWSFVNMFSSKANKVLYFNKILDDCPDIFNKSEKIAIQYRNVSHILTKSGYLMINYRLHVLRDLPNNLTFKMFIQRCAIREAPDTCIRFSTVSTNKMCGFLSSKIDAWTSFVSCVTPSMKCPVHKGEYIGSNCSLSMERFNMFPLGNSYWKFRCELHNKKDMLGCIINEGFAKNVV